MHNDSQKNTWKNNWIPEIYASTEFWCPGIHSRNTRFGKLNLRCPIYNNSTEGERSFSVRSIKDWNNLIQELNLYGPKKFQKAVDKLSFD